MKFLSKFWLVAVVSVGLYSCDSGVEDKPIESTMENDSLVKDVVNDTLEIIDGIQKVFSFNQNESSMFLTTYTPIVDTTYPGFNIGTNFYPGTVDGDTTIPSRLRFQVVERLADGTYRYEKRAFLDEKTVELEITSQNSMEAKLILSKHAHFDSSVTFQFSNSVDFKISLQKPGSDGNLWIVGTEDDRPFCERSAQFMADMTVPATGPKPRIRLSYLPTGIGSGVVLVSYQNAKVNIVKNTACKFEKTGVPEIKGWGIKYTRSCKGC